jgi:hypothetical protein
MHSDFAALSFSLSRFVYALCCLFEALERCMFAWGHWRSSGIEKRHLERFYFFFISGCDDEAGQMEYGR